MSGSSDSVQCFSYCTMLLNGNKTTVKPFKVMHDRVYHFLVFKNNNINLKYKKVTYLNNNI